MGQGALPDATRPLFGGSPSRRHLVGRDRGLSHHPVGASTTGADRRRGGTLGFNWVLIARACVQVEFKNLAARVRESPSSIQEGAPRGGPRSDQHLSCLHYASREPRLTTQRTPCTRPTRKGGRPSSGHRTDAPKGPKEVVSGQQALRQTPGASAKRRGALS